MIPSLRVGGVKTFLIIDVEQRAAIHWHNLAMVATAYMAAKVTLLRVFAGDVVQLQRSLRHILHIVDNVP